VLESLEASALADAVRTSLLLTAGLSAVHVVGFMLVMSGALLANLRLVGALFADRPIAEIVTPAHKAILAGVVINVVTGGMMFSERATAAASSRIFQTKMALFVVALLVQFVLLRATGSGPRRASGRAAGVAGLCAWTSLALTACAYILLE
jgi:hypothetical protein